MISASLSVLILAATFTQALASPRLTISVGPQVGDEFSDVDTGIRDSIKDINDELRRSGLFTIATSQERAVLRLVVVARHASGISQTLGETSPGAIIGSGNAAGVQQPSIRMSSLTTTTTIVGRVLETKLRVGDSEKTFLSGDDLGGSWRYTARQLVKDLTGWVKANRDAIPEPVPTAPVVR
jgi:hypothetical protein